MGKFELYNPNKNFLDNLLTFNQNISSTILISRLKIVK